MYRITEFLTKLLDSSDWPARWHCGTWTGFHGWLYIISDLLIWSAYFTIAYKDVATFAILAFVLIFKPTGILGRPEVEKV